MSKRESEKYTGEKEGEREREEALRKRKRSIYKREKGMVICQRQSN